MSINIGEIFKRLGLNRDNRRWYHNGVECSDGNLVLYPQYNWIIIDDPELKALLAPAIKQIGALGYTKLDSIKLQTAYSENSGRIDIIFNDSCNSTQMGVFVTDGGVYIRINNEQTAKHMSSIDIKTPGPNLLWALTYLRGMYTGIFFARLPQPIAEEIDSEFAFFFPRGFFLT